MIIRITTERKHVKWVYSLIGEYFPGFTVYNVIGYWRGKQEKSIVFEIDTIGTPNHLLDWSIKKIIQGICGINRQDVILVQKIESDSKWLGSSWLGG